MEAEADITIPDLSGSSYLDIAAEEEEQETSQFFTDWQLLQSRVGTATQRQPFFCFYMKTVTLGSFSVLGTVGPVIVNFAQVKTELNNFSGGEEEEVLSTECNCSSKSLTR